MYNILKNYLRMVSLKKRHYLDSVGNPVSQETKLNNTICFLLTGFLIKEEGRRW